MPVMRSRSRLGCGAGPRRGRTIGARSCPKRRTPPADRWGFALDVVGAADLERPLRVVRWGVFDLHVVVVVRGDLMRRALLTRREERLHRALVLDLESDIAPGKAARETTGLHTINSSRGCGWMGLPSVGGS